MQERYKSTTFAIKVRIGLMFVLAVLGMILCIHALYLFISDAESSVPLWARLILLGTHSAFTGLLLVFGLAGLRRNYRLLTQVRTGGLEIGCDADGLTFSSQGRSYTYRWADIGAVRTDRDYLSIGPVPTRPAVSLLLLDRRAPKKPSLRLRLKLGRAIRRATLAPVDVEGTTVIPLKSIIGADAKRLIEHAPLLHRQAAG